MLELGELDLKEGGWDEAVDVGESELEGLFGL